MVILRRALGGTVFAPAASPVAAVPSFVGAATAGGNLDTLTPTWPSVAANDVAYVLWTMSNTSTPTAAPTGFTQVAQTDGPAGANPRSYVYRKVCAGTETGTLSLALSTGATRQSACLVVYRGVNTTTPEDVAVAVDNTHATQQTHNPPPITISSANCAILTSVHERATSIDANWTAPTGYTERADTLTLATGTGGTITAVADLLTTQSAGATITPPNWTGDSVTGTANIITYTIALRPA